MPVLVILKSGLFLPSKETFGLANDYLKKANIDKSCIVDYQTHRNTVEAMRERKLSETEIQKSMEENFATWFTQLRLTGSPKGDLLGINDENVFAAEKFQEFEQKLRNDNGHEVWEMTLSLIHI